MSTDANDVNTPGPAASQEDRSAAQSAEARIGTELQDLEARFNRIANQLRKLNKEAFEAYRTLAALEERLGALKIWRVYPFPKG